MAVRVGSARIDSRGKASGDKAGDQTGREVAIENYYVHPQGWYIIRAKDPATREKIAKGMERACANNNVGYDQGQNKTLWHEAEKVDWDPGKVKTPCETDCARLVRVCVRYAGIKADDFFTGDELEKLQKTGKFEIIKDKRCNSSAELMRGDILVTRTKGHTVVVLDDGATTKANKAKQTTPAKKQTTKKQTTPAKKTTKKATTPTYKVGKTYTIVASALNVRTAPNGKKKSRAQLTADGRKHANANGALKKGTKVTCKATTKIGNDIWMQIPSGWIAAYYNKNTYVK